MTATIEQHEYWTVREVADRWRCSPDTVLRMIGDDTIRAMKLGGAWRIHQSVIEAHERGTKTATAQHERKPRKVAASVPDLIGDL